MRIAIVDSETGGLDPAEHPLLEVGMVVWSADHRAIVACSSRLIMTDKGNAAEHINGIRPGLLNPTDADDRESAMRHFATLAKGCDVIAAHRAEFDRGFLPELAGHPWLCTKFDVEWPGVPIGSSLNETSLALLGYATRGHRALADCLTLARCFERVAELVDFDAWLAKGLRPRKLYEVEDRTFNRERNAKAKAAGFAFNGTAWRKRMSDDELGGLAFAVREVVP